MTVKLTIPLVTEDQETVRKVTLAVSGGDGLPPVSVHRSVADLGTGFNHQVCPLMIVDVDPDPPRALGELGQLLSHRPTLRAVIISRMGGSELILQAMQAGARHFLTKDAVPGELAAALQKLIPPESAREFGHGSVVSVLSASGGSGVTTITVNLVNELQALSASTVLLVDMDDCYGSVATYLGLRGNYGLADVLAQADAPDLQLVRTSATAYTENVHVLLSPVTVNFAEPAALQLDHLPALLGACRRGFAYTVIDAPHMPPPRATALALQSHLVLLVLQMTVQDIQYVRNLRAVLARGGVPLENILLVVNRYEKRSPTVSFDECRKALGDKNLLLIRNDFRNAIRGINYGKPLSELAPSSVVRKDIRSLAQHVLLALNPAAGKEIAR